MDHPKDSPQTEDAYRLMHEGAVALAQIESNGIRVDNDYMVHTMDDLSVKITDLERELQTDKEVYPVWKRVYGNDTNLGSKQQLGEVLFRHMGYVCKNLTPTKRFKVDEEALQDVDLPFVRQYTKLDKFKKAHGTFLTGLRRQVVDGFFHPIFNLHTARTFRSSSGNDKEDDRGIGKDFNLQNIPVRNPEIGELVRRCFVPRENHILTETDYTGIEVRVSACYNHDPVLIEYIKDTSKDMHRDMAMQLYCLKQWQVNKTARYCAKNQFVFPQFYGSYYLQCAPHLWDAIDRMNIKAKIHKDSDEEVPLKDILAKKGITELGACDSKQSPLPGTYEHHVKTVEDDFWNRRFHAYSEWKKRWHKNYLETGGFTTLTGFRIEGVYKRNEVLNYPIQGSAFHCLLWSLIRVHKWLRKHKMKSMIVGQIHDSLLLDVHRREVQDVLHKVHTTMTVDLPRAWPWLIVPLDVEVEASRKNWFEKSKWHCVDNVWCKA